MSARGMLAVMKEDTYAMWQHCGECHRCNMTSRSQTWKGMSISMPCGTALLWCQHGESQGEQY